MVDMRAVISVVDQDVFAHKQQSPFMERAVHEALWRDETPFEAPSIEFDASPGVSTTTTATATASRTTSSSTQTDNSSIPNSSRREKKRVTFSSKLLSCMCVQPAARASDSGLDAVPALSPRRSMRLHKCASAAYSDAEWFDARSELSSALSGAASDPATKLEELSAMLREGTHLALPLGPSAPPAKGRHIPSPPLAFADPGLVFVPVPAVTGFAAYWERDQERSTAHPSPIDIMISASALAVRSHASIPGIWLQETEAGFSVTVKPRFMPPGLPRYTETYDKTNATEPSWNLRRDLRLGSTSGQIFYTACGMLVLRARSKPLWGSSHDYVMEEYLRLEEGGQVIVDRMCCLDLKTGARATQYVVGHHHEVPLKGHV